MNHISKALRGVADKYNGVSLIIRIIVGLIAGTALALRRANSVVWTASL